MSLYVWLAYLGLVFVLCLTPGAAVLFVLSQAIWRGPLAAFKAALAVNVSNTILFILSGLGLAVLVTHHPKLFFIVKLFGAAWLVWLGVSAIRDSFREARAEAPLKQRPFVDGLIVQLSNPAALLFFAAVLPPFIDPARNLTGQVLILTVTCVVVESITLTGFALAGGALRRSSRLAFARIWMNRISGLLLIGVGVMSTFLRV